MMGYLNNTTTKDVLSWSHRWATMSLRSGAVISVSTSKQKINTRSSPEAEHVSIDNIISKVLWIEWFLVEVQS